MMCLNWFSPLPPEQTDIAHYTARIAPALMRRFDVVFWTGDLNYRVVAERASVCRWAKEGQVEQLVDAYNNNDGEWRGRSERERVVQTTSGRARGAPSPHFCLHLAAHCCLHRQPTQRCCTRSRTGRCRRCASPTTAETHNTWPRAP